MDGCFDRCGNFEHIVREDNLEHLNKLKVKPNFSKFFILRLLNIDLCLFLNKNYLHLIFI